MSHCLIVGAGISGLLAAHTLQNAGIRVTVLDKGRGVGGRMATRRLGQGGRADHGTQFFTVRSDTFRHWVDQWLAAGVVQEWSRGFPPNNPNDGHPRYRGTHGMTDIAKHLAQAVPVHTSTRVAKIAQDASQWTITTTEEAVFTADALLLTSPVPQSLDLLAAGTVTLPAEAQAQLARLAYSPCFAVMVTLDGRSNLPEPGGIQVNGEPITWIGDNYMKGISERTAVTIHASPEFTRQHFDADDRTAVGQLLVNEAHQQGWLDKSRIRDMQVHRWKFAQPTTYHTERTLLIDQLPPLAFAGDVFYEAKVEGAALSGLAAAEALLERLI